MKKIISTAVMALATISSPLYAARPSMANPGWFADIGLEGYYYHYRENTRQDNFLMSHKGPMYGLYYVLGYQPESMALRFAWEGRFARGTDIYYSSQNTGNMNGCCYTASEQRLIGTYSWDLENQNKIEGYTGIANRSMVNDDFDRQSTTGHYGWLRTSSYVYIPLGVRYAHCIEDMQLATHLEYDWFIRGLQTSRAYGVNTRNDQNNGLGMRLGVDLLIPSSYGCFDYNIGAFIRYWNIGDSTVNQNSMTSRTDLYYEPRNKTYEIGIRLGLAF
jgi:hypothetical protein